MRERSSRDAKKSSRGTAVEAWRIEDCERSDSNVNLYLSVSSLTNTTSVKMAGLLGKKFPTPVGMFNARSGTSIRPSSHASMLTLLLQPAPWHPSTLPVRFHHRRMRISREYPDIDNLFPCRRHHLLRHQLPRHYPRQQSVPPTLSQPYIVCAVLHWPTEYFYLREIKKTDS